MKNYNDALTKNGSRPDENLNTKLAVSAVIQRDFSSFKNIVEKENDVNLLSSGLRNALESCIYDEKAVDFIKYLIEKDLFAKIFFLNTRKTVTNKNFEALFRKNLLKPYRLYFFHNLELLKYLFGSELLKESKTASIFLWHLLLDHHITDYENLFDYIQFLIDNGAQTKQKIKNNAFIRYIEHRPDGGKIVALLAKNGLKCKYNPESYSYLYAIQNEEILETIKAYGCKLNKKSNVVINSLDWYKSNYEPKLKELVSSQEKFEANFIIKEIANVFYDSRNTYEFYPMSYREKIEAEISEKTKSFFSLAETMIKKATDEQPGEIVFKLYKHQIIEFSGPAIYTKMEVKIREIFMMLLCRKLISSGIDISYKDGKGDSLISIAKQKEVNDLEFAVFLSQH